MSGNPREQVSDHVPSKADHLVDVDLLLVCGFCGTGHVAALAKGIDHRVPLTCWCDNPRCGDQDDDDKGRQQYIMVTENGEFLKWGDPPVSDPPAPPKASEHLQRVRAAVKATRK